MAPGDVESSPPPSSLTNVSKGNQAFTQRKQPPHSLFGPCRADGTVDNKEPGSREHSLVSSKACRWECQVLGPGLLLRAWASALARELDLSSWNNQVAGLTQEDFLGAASSQMALGRGPRMGHFLQGVLGPCADSSSLITCQFPGRNTSAGGVSARVRRKRAAEAVGLGEVGASRARPRHTWETGEGEEREQRWLKRQRERKQGVGGGG